MARSTFYYHLKHGKRKDKYKEVKDMILLLSAKSFNKKKERADSIIVESAQIVTFVFATKLQ